MHPTPARTIRQRLAGRGVLGTALAVTAVTITLASAAAPASAAGQRDWVAAWTGSAVVGATGTANTCPAGTGLTNQTVRNAVYLSAGGAGVRVRLTNAFGAKALTVGKASVAIQQQGATPKAGSMRQLTFGGKAGVTVPAGGQLYSDYTDLAVGPLTTLLVSVYVPNATGPVTNHPFTTNTNFIASGDQTVTTAASGFTTVPCWMLIDAVDIANAGSGQHFAGAVVALGDSITDTANTKGDANHRWTDLTADRFALMSSTPAISIVNAGLGGNRLLADRPGQPYYGVAALSRLDRDVFSQSGVTALVVLIGTNDLGYGAGAEEIIAGYQKIITKSRARGLRVFGGTIPPMNGSAIWSPQSGKAWEAVNTWIRTSKAFDGVIDFAAALGDSADPTRLAASYDSGDHLHPNDTGTAAMAMVVPLRALIDTARPRG